MSIKIKALKLHKKLKGKVEIKGKIKLSKKNLELLYTPGVAEVSRKISKNKSLAYDYTSKGNTIAILTNGTSVLSLGNIGAEAALPVIEGKSLLFKELGDVNAIPLCLSTSTKDLISIARKISPSFSAILLEDIETPGVFDVRDSLKNLGIPVFHDDSEGTAIVTLAALKNALKVVNKKLNNIKIVIIGAGAAGIGIAELLSEIKQTNIHLVDSKGVIYPNRGNMDKYKKKISDKINKTNIKGTLEDVLKNSDVVIAVTGKKDLLKKKHIKLMNKNPIVFALSNPYPELTPKKAKEYKVKIIATGSSQYPNQVNNIYVFPAVFRGLLDSRATTITKSTMIKISTALANQVKPNKNRILPKLSKKLILKISRVIK